MAHFAKISEENEVLTVVTLNDNDMKNSDGVEMGLFLVVLFLLHLALLPYLFVWAHLFSTGLEDPVASLNYSDLEVGLPARNNIRGQNAQRRHNYSTSVVAFVGDPAEGLDIRGRNDPASRSCSKRPLLHLV